MSTRFVGQVRISPSAVAGGMCQLEINDLDAPNWIGMGIEASMLAAADLYEVTLLSGEREGQEATARATYIKDTSQAALFGTGAFEPGPCEICRITTDRLMEVALSHGRQFKAKRAWREAEQAARYAKSHTTDACPRRTA